MTQHPIETDIVLIDIIDFSRLPMTRQLEIISYLSHTYRKMLKMMLKSSGIPMKRMLLGLIPTGDGFYCILHPDLKGFGPILGLSLLHFSDYIAKEYPYFQGIRVAVHTGKIFRFEDILGQDNYVGDGLNECARYIEIKNLLVNTVIISDAAYRSLEAFLQHNPDFHTLLRQCEFRHSSLHTFSDKHKIERHAYLIWMRQGAIIPPPKLHAAPSRSTKE